MVDVLLVAMFVEKPIDERCTKRSNKEAETKTMCDEMWGEELLIACIEDTSPDKKLRSKQKRKMRSKQSFVYFLAIKQLNKSLSFCLLVYFKVNTSPAFVHLSVHKLKNFWCQLTQSRGIYN
jgi:hypothetical protein